MRRRARSRFGALHLAVSNAGITGDHGVKLADTGMDAWRQVVATNLDSVFLWRAAPAEVTAGFARSQPLGRLATRKEIADTVAFPLSDEASFLTGGFYMADRGYTTR